MLFLNNSLWPSDVHISSNIFEIEKIMIIFDKN